MLRPRQVLALFKDAGNKFFDDKAPRLGAALSYYTVFSIAPLLVIAIAVAGAVFGEQAARGEVTSALSGLLGPSGAQAVQQMLQNARQPGHGLIAGALGVLTLLFGATGVFGELQDSLNTIWGVQPRSDLTFWKKLKARFMPFTMVIGTCFLLLASLVATAALGAVGKFMSQHLPGGEAVWHIVNFAISFAVTTALFAVIFKVLPDIRAKWKDVWLGAALTAVLFTIGKFAIGLYLGKASVGSTYGAAGSLAVFMVWVYYSAQLVLFGVEFTYVYAVRYGSRFTPNENAVPTRPLQRIAS